MAGRGAADQELQAGVARLATGRERPRGLPGPPPAPADPGTAAQPDPALERGVGRVPGLAAQRASAGGPRIRPGQDHVAPALQAAPGPEIE